MLCNACRKHEALEGRQHCISCFVRLTQQTVRKALKEALHGVESYNLEPSRSAAGILLARMAASVESRAKQSDDAKVILSSATLDEFNSQFLENLTSRKPSEVSAESIKFPLAAVSLADCELFCEIKGLPFERQQLSSPTAVLLQKLEKRYPGMHHGLKSARDKLEGTR